MMHTLRLLPFLWIALVAGCGTDPRRSSQERPSNTELTMVYRKAGAGMGHSPMSAVVLVPTGTHPPLMATMALQRALHQFSAQIIAPDLVTLKDSDTNLRWQSDIGPLTAPQLSSYNSIATHPQLRHRLFGVQFSGRLVMVNNEMRFSIESRLFGRGAAEPWTEVESKDYAGSHFGVLLSTALRQELLAQDPR